MYCPKCGTQINEGAAFCPQCGTPISTPSQPQKSEAQNKNYQNNKNTFNTVKTHKKKKKGILIAIVAVLLIAGITTATVILCRGKSYEKVIEEFLDAGFTNDVESVLNLMPDEFVSQLMQEYGYSPSERYKFILELSNNPENIVDTLTDTYGENWDYSYEIDTVIDIPEQELQQTLLDLKSYFSSQLNFDNITHLKGVYFTIHIESENGNESMPMGLLLGKIDGSWYVLKGL